MPNSSFKSIELFLSHCAPENYDDQTLGLYHDGSLQLMDDEKQRNGLAPQEKPALERLNRYWYGGDVGASAEYSRTSVSD
jgi:hypothetical protein